MGVIVAGLLGAIVLSRAEGVARLAAGFVPIQLHNMGEKIALALDLQFKPSSVVQMIALVGTRPKFESISVFCFVICCNVTWIFLTPIA